MRRLFSILAVAVAMVSACDHPVGPVDEQRRQDLLVPLTPQIYGSLGRTTEELTFARYLGVTPPSGPITITVTKGEASTHEVRYDGQDPSDPPVFSFQVGTQSLLALNGVPLQEGDEVDITITFDPALYVYHFQPSGLTFSPIDPARLRLNYAYANPDVNGDGSPNFLDLVLQNRFRIWRRDALELPWVQIPTIRLPFDDILEGRVEHFTGFAMAS